jgi:DNA-binding XRE family transcriptional regulator
MKAAKRRKLEARGYRVTDTKEFLGLSDAEARLVELKVSLIERVKEIREANKVTQAELAKLLKSSQSRVAKIEAGASDVSLDLICRALFALGESPAAVQRAVSRRAGRGG